MSMATQKLAFVRCVFVGSFGIISAFVYVSVKVGETASWNFSNFLLLLELTYLNFCLLIVSFYFITPGPGDMTPM